MYVKGIFKSLSNETSFPFAYDTTYNTLSLLAHMLAHLMIPHNQQISFISLKKKTKKNQLYTHLSDSPGISCTQNHHFYLWIFPTTASTSGKNWPMENEDWKHVRSFPTVLKCNCLLKFQLVRPISWILTPEETYRLELPTLDSVNSRTITMATRILTILP